MQPSSQLPEWVSYLSALATPIISLVIGACVAYIAWRQWKTAHTRLRFDLFQKRFEIYQGYCSVGAQIIQDGIERTEFSPEFLRAWAQAEFFFGNEIVDRFAELHRRVSELQRSWQKMTTTSDDTQKNELSARNVIELNWIKDRTIEITPMFSKYMKINNTQ